MATCSEESHGAGRSDGSEVRVILEEILLQLGEDVFPVCVLPQGRDVRPEHKKTLDKTSYFVLPILRHSISENPFLITLVTF
jgi:hypothetical protein